jgi:methylenetetrahydrofolate dehydrogenase (NADP+)/methenyltetrahydrofolate cyclohydrolase
MGNINILNGKKLAESLYEMQDLCLADDVELRKPKLVVITIGDDDASKVYVRNKKKACEKCNIIFEQKHFSEDEDINIVLDYMKHLNIDRSVDGIMVQLPVPYRFKGIEQAIMPDKDVDGFSTYNLGGTLNNVKHIPACTPNGIMELLHYNDIDLEGKNVVIIGRSNIVGKPLIGMLLERNATVTICHSKTENIKNITANADILIVAIGKPKFINSYYITSKCMCIIDVGMNRDENGELCGDVDFEDIVNYWKMFSTDNIERYITPVPGGVGPMTVYSLVKNVNMIYSEQLY